MTQHTSTRKASTIFQIYERRPPTTQHISTRNKHPDIKEEEEEEEEEERAIEILIFRSLFSKVISPILNKNFYLFFFYRHLYVPR